MGGLCYLDRGKVVHVQLEAHVARVLGLLLAHVLAESLLLLLCVVARFEFLFCIYLFSNINPTARSKKKKRLNYIYLLHLLPTLRALLLVLHRVFKLLLQLELCRRGLVDRVRRQLLALSLDLLVAKLVVLLLDTLLHVKGCGVLGRG